MGRRWNHQAFIPLFHCLFHAIPYVVTRHSAETVRRSLSSLPGLRLVLLIPSLSSFGGSTPCPVSSTGTDMGETASSHGNNPEKPASRSPRPTAPWSSQRWNQAFALGDSMLRSLPQPSTTCTHPPSRSRPSRRPTLWTEYCTHYSTFVALYLAGSLARGRPIFFVVRQWGLGRPGVSG